MKILKILNVLSIAVPILLAFVGLFDEMFTFYALISTMFTGVVQTILAVVFWIRNSRNLHVKIYFTVSALFFLYFFAFREFGLDDVFSFKFWILPTLLCLYLSWMIFFGTASGKQENQS